MSGFSNDEVEQLRVRYRQEALKAVEEAEKRAFKKGQEDAQRRLEEELTSLRTDNKALRAVVQSYKEQTEAPDGAKPQMRPLLRHIMEQVYGEMKKSFDKSSSFTGEHVVTKMKTVLVSQADTLAHTIGDLPILAVKPPVQSAATGENVTHSLGAIVGVTNIVTDGSTASPAQSPTQDAKRSAYSESPKHSLVPDNSSIARLLSVKDDLPNPAAAIFREFTTMPNLDIVVAIKGIEKHDAGVFGTFASYEMQSAVVQLQSMSKKPQYYTCSHRYRDFDNLHAQLKKILPHAMLPSLPPKDISVGNNLRDDFVQTRRRGLRLWMQHVSMHPELQRCPTLAQFVCGGRVPQSWPVDANMIVAKPSVRVSRRIRFNKLGKHQRTPSIFREEPSDAVAENSVPVQSESDRERANRLVMTVAKNHAAMQQPVKAALEATSKLLGSMQEQAAARQELHSALCQFALVESGDKQIQTTISSMAQALGKGATKYSQTESVLLAHLHQPLLFYGVNCMQTAKSCIEAVGSMERDQKVEAASDLVGEWVTLRQLRHASQLRDLTAAAEGMLELHASMQEAWQEVHVTIGPQADLSPRAFKTPSSWNDSVRRHPQLAPHHDYLTAFPKRYAPTEHPALVHAAETKPIVPPGVRQLPEKIFTNMRDYLAEQSQPNIRPVPDATPSMPSTYRTSSEPYVDPFMDSPYHAYSRRISTGTTPIPTRNIIDPFAQPRYPTEDSLPAKSPVPTASMPEKHKPRSDRELRHSTSDATGTTPGSLFGRGLMDRMFASHGSSGDSAPAAAPNAPVNKAPNSAVPPAATTSATPTATTTQTGDEETPMSRLYKERVADWEREQAVAQNKQRNELLEQIKQDKELNDDIADRRRRARTNAQTKHTGQNARLRKPTKKQAAVPQQEEYVPPVSTRPVNYAGYQPALSSSLVDDRPRHQDPFQERQQRVSRAGSSPPRPDLFAAGRSSESAAPLAADGSRRTSTADNAQNRPSVSPRHSVSDEQFECENENSEPLPDGWEEVFTADGKRYYYHTLSRASRWDRPTKDIADRVAERYNATQKAMDDAVERRRREREGEIREQEQRAQRTTELKARIRGQVVAWSKSKPMHLLLKDSQTIVPFITIDAATTALSGTSTSGEVKKAYMKIVRQIHPDKLTSMELDNQILAEEVFTVLAESFEKFRGSS